MQLGRMHNGVSREIDAIMKGLFAGRLLANPRAVKEIEYEDMHIRSKTNVLYILI
jgi:hypothetical protein